MCASDILCTWRSVSVNPDSWSNTCYRPQTGGAARRTDVWPALVWSWRLALSVCHSVWVSVYLPVFVYLLLTSLPSTRQHSSYGDCLEAWREYYQNSSVLDCVTQCSQYTANLYEQFLQVKQIGTATVIFHIYAVCCPYRWLDISDVWPWPLTLRAILVLVHYFSRGVRYSITQVRAVLRHTEFNYLC